MIIVLFFLFISITLQEGTWWKGATHTHANWGPPQLPWTDLAKVASWYREHHYNFVSITDLNYFTPTEGLEDFYNAPGRFIVIPGIELSAEPLGVGVKIIDTIGLAVRENIHISPGSIDVDGGLTTNEVLESQLRDITAARGIPIIAHPGLTWALNASDFIDLNRRHNPLFFEVYNSEPGMNCFGGGGRPSYEEIWDEVLSSGRVMYGVAADDSHHFNPDHLIQSTRPDERVSNPGRAWIYVRSEELTTRSLIRAMKEGDFYASTGVKLLDYHVNSTTVSLVLDSSTNDLGWSVGGNNPLLYKTTFIGRNGDVLKVDTSLNPHYTFDEGDLYIRAKVVSSDGGVAWLQPVFRE